MKYTCIFKSEEIPHVALKYKCTHTCTQLAYGRVDVLNGHGWAIMEKSVSFMAPASIKTSFPFPPSSAGVPITESWNMNKS